MGPVNFRDKRDGEGRRGPGYPTHVHKFLMWEVKKVEGNSSLWCQWKDKKQWAQTEIQDIPFKHKEKFIYYRKF